MIVRRQGYWLSGKVGDELVIMNPEEEHYIGLNDVGARIWELIETAVDVDALCVQLEREFEVTLDVAQAEPHRLPGICREFPRASIPRHFG